MESQHELDQIYEQYQQIHDEQECPFEGIQHSFDREQFSSKLSRIHEKYLPRQDFTPTISLSYKSETYRGKQSSTNQVSQKPVVSMKRKENKRKKVIYDPLIGKNLHCKDTLKLEEELSNKINDFTCDQSDIFHKYGLKPPKKLGKAKAIQELSNILAYFQAGNLPEEYRSAFRQLLAGQNLASANLH